MAGEILPGRIIADIPDILKDRLREIGGGKYHDASRQDSSDVTALLKCGLSPGDAYSTFAASPRGKDAQIRKTGHFHDYLQRTIRSSLTFLGKTLEDYQKKVETNGNGNGHHKDVISDNHIRVDFSRKRNKKTHEGIHVTTADKVETERVRWLWEDFIPAGKITILAGDPGKGKSTIAIDLVARISRGGSLPLSDRSISGSCLIASAEDAPEDTITPRLIAARANLKKVGLLRQVMIDGELHYLSLPRDINRLRELIIERGARLIVIDPLNAFLSRSTDSYKDQDIRAVLAPLEDLAEETSAAVLIVAHLNKKEETSTLYRIGGSIGIVGAARSVLSVADTPKKGISVLFSLKRNLGKKPPSLAYDTQQIRKKRIKKTDWLGEDTIVSSRIRWRGKIDFDPMKGSAVGLDKSVLEAEEFLKQVLQDGGEVDSEEIYKEGKRAGIARPTVNAAKSQLGLKTKRGQNGSWTWRLP